jgi:hydrogenase expression/formation protein HypC
MCLAIPGKIEKITNDDPLMRKGRVNFGGIHKEVCLAYVPEAKIGDYAMIHVGFALNLMSEADANESLDLLRQLAETEAEFYPDTENEPPLPALDGKAK